MKNSKRITALLLLLAMLLPTTAACGESEQQETETNAAETTADAVPAIEESETDIADTPDTLPAGLDFGGETYTIHVRGDDSPWKDFYAEESSAEVVEEATYLRNMLVEERLNIALEFVRGEGWNGYDTAITTFRNMIAGGDSTYDMIAGWSARIPSIAISGLLTDLYTLAYLDLEQPWWIQSLVDELTIKNRIYFATGDIVKTALQNAYLFYFNKSVAEEYKVNDMYELVFEGRWTIDAMSERIAAVYKDTNGNGVKDGEDVVGTKWAAGNDIVGFLQSSKIQMITRDEDGLPQLELETDKLVTLVEKVYAVVYENDGAMVDKEFKINAGDMFKNDQMLLMSGIFEHAAVWRDMESDFGMLPYPKFDEAQDGYYTRIHDGIALMCVPITCAKMDSVGAVLEALAAEGYRRITPALYDVALKSKYPRDEESQRVLDLVRSGSYLNFASVYNESIGSPWSILIGLVGNKKKDAASWLAQREKSFQAGIDRVIQAVEEAES